MRARRRLGAWIGLPLAALNAVAPIEAVVGQGATLEFRDIDALLTAPVVTRPAFGDLALEREPQTMPRSGRAGSLDPSLGPAIASLSLDAEVLRAAARIPIGIALPSGSPLIAFDFGDRVFSMALVEIVADAEFDVLHYTLLSAKGRDYARLTIARNGPEIVGTVFLERDEFRILPFDGDRQLVHPVNQYRGEFRSARGPLLDTLAGRIEARHLQMAWYAERRPERFRTQQGGRLDLVSAGTRIEAIPGQVDIHSAMELNAEGETAADKARLALAVESFLNDISHITLIDDPVSVRIDSADLGPIFQGLEDEAEIRFTQTINGVPTDEENHLTIDGAGRVTEFRSELMRPATAERRGGSELAAEAAQSAAMAAVTGQLEIDWPLETRASELIYDYAENFTRLDLFWRVTLASRDCPLHFIVDVRARSGEIANVKDRRTFVDLGRVDRNVVEAQCRR